MFCTGCLSTICTNESIKHFEKGTDQQVLPIDEINRSVIATVNFIEIMHTLLNHTLTDLSQDAVKEMEWCRMTLSKLQHEFSNKLKHGYV